MSEKAGISSLMMQKASQSGGQLSYTNKPRKKVKEETKQKELSNL
jgi:hypothetical protein